MATNALYRALLEDEKGQEKMKGGEGGFVGSLVCAGEEEERATPAFQHPRLGCWGRQRTGKAGRRRGNREGGCARVVI